MQASIDPSRLTLFSRRFNSVAYASLAALDPRIQPMTTPTSSTAGMKRKWLDGISAKFTAASPAVSRRRPEFAFDGREPAPEHEHVDDEREPDDRVRHEDERRRRQLFLFDFAGFDGHEPVLAAGASRLERRRPGAPEACPAEATAAQTTQHAARP